MSVGVSKFNAWEQRDIFSWREVVSGLRQISVFFRFNFFKIPPLKNGHKCDCVLISRAHFSRSQLGQVLVISRFHFKESNP